MRTPATDLWRGEATAQAVRRQEPSACVQEKQWMPVMPNTCDQSSGCRCASDSQVYSSQEALEERMLQLAANGRYQPVTAAIVVTAYDFPSKKVAWNFHYNRTLVTKVIDQVDQFAFYNSMYWQTYTSGGFLPLQRFTDSFFVSKLTPAYSGSTEAIRPYFQAFPFPDWKYSDAKFGFLGGGYFQM